MKTKSNHKLVYFAIYYIVIKSWLYQPNPNFKLALVYLDKGIYELKLSQIVLYESN